MKKLTIYYDDTKQSCRRFADEFLKYENVECRKISEYQEQRIIFADRVRIGLIFESQDGQIPAPVLHIIRRVVADKEEKHLVCVTGGRRELQALHAAREEMQQRAYQVSNLYTKYIFEKHRLGTAEAVARMAEDMEDGRENVLFKEKYRGCSGREFRKHLRQEIKQYRKYKKALKNARQQTADRGKS